MKRTSFMKRCLALVLALGIVIPNVNWAALRVSAAEGDEKVITAGELVAKNYELTDAEDDLLNSGYLAGDSYTYTVPTDKAGLVTIDTENKQITAGEFENWVPVTAEITAENMSQEIVDFEGKVAKYTYDGNAFSVDVTYTYDVEVAEDAQNVLLNAAAELKRGVNEMETAYDASDANLGTVVEAMDVLVQLADGIPAASWLTLQFGEDAQEAVYALQAEMADNNNDGTLKLQEMNAAYADSASKVEYLVKNGAEYKEAIETTYANLKAIAEDKDVTGNSNVESYFEGNDPAMGRKWAAFKNIVGTTVSGLEPVATAEAWNTASVKSGLTAAEYAAMDTLVAAVGTTAEVTVKNPLNVDVAVVKANASMYNVTVNVVLHTVKDKDSDELTANAIEPLTLTLVEGAAAEEVIAKITASGIEDQAKREWGEAYAAEGYERTATVLSGELTSDIVYTIEYKPVDCEVTFGYEGAEKMTVPYGYQMTLPVHEDVEQAFDYTIEDVIYAQGSVYTVKGDVTINRAAGKAYTTTDLYAIIGDNFGNDVAKAILESGALEGNVTISVRKPDPTDSQNLLKLEGDTLTAVATYPASYNGLNWTPYTYGTTGTENEFNGNTASWNENSAKVQYILELDVTAEEVDEILKMVATLKGEAKGQIETLDKLMGHYSVMAELDKTKLGAMSGTVGVTELVDTNGDGVINAEDDENAAENVVMQQYFKAIIDDLIKNGVDTNNKLKLYNMLTQYNGDGLKYYYENAEAVKAEIDALSGYLTGMVGDTAKMDALEALLIAVEYPQYVEKISTIEQTLKEVKEELTLPNEVIDLTSENLEKLTDALSADGNVITDAAAAPYLVSDVLTVMDSTMKMIQVIVDINGKTYTVTTAPIEKGTVITEEVVAGLKIDIENLVNEKLGNKEPYYEYVVTGDEVVVGAKLENTLNQTYTYSAKKYTVEIAGEQQIVTADALTINLAKHADSAYTYKYIIDGQEIDAAVKTSYTFTLDQLDNLFVNGTYNIARTVVNIANEKLEDTFEDLNNNTSGNIYEIVKDGEGNITGLIANVKGDKNGIMSFVMDLVNSGYSYIGLNDEALMYLNNANELEVSLQTLINAIVADTEFGSQTLIDLGNNNGGKLVTADMQLGSDADNIDFEALDFVLDLDGVPAQMVKVAKGLDAVKNYMSFQSHGEHMDVALNLPEKVYEAYLTALLATGTVDKSDVNAVDNQIAFDFLYDYIELVIENEDVTATTFENTLKKLDNAVNDKTDYDLPDYDLSAYDEYYQLIRKALTSENLVIDSQPENLNLGVTASGDSILKLVDVLGIDLSSYDTYMAMIKELKDGGFITGNAKATLENTDENRNFEAALIDVRNDSLIQKADYTDNLPARLTEVDGAAGVMLLDTVDGDLVFNGTTVLDLNGQVVNGNIVANGKLIIVDSRMNNDKAGRVNGTVTGAEVAIIGGAYAYDVSEHVKDGYETVAKAIDGNNYNLVQSELFTVSTGANGELAYAINTGIAYENIDRYKVFAAELAADIAVDLVANYYTTAALSAEGKEIYGFDFYDFVDLVESDSIPTDLLNRALECLNLPETADFINMVIEDLLDFGAIESALNNNQPVATYTLSTAPWMIEVEHITDGDYLTVGIGPNSDLTKNFTVSLQFSGEYTDEMAQAAALLDKIVVDDTYIRLVDVEDLTYADKNFNLTGGAEAHIHLDLSDYTTAMAIIVANGIEDETMVQNIVAAVNAGNDEALKDEFDKLTVKDVFDAIKVLNRNDDLQALADKVGMNVTIDPNEKLEKLLVMSLAAAGKALEHYEITGTDATLGNLDTDDDGIYEWAAQASRSGNVSKRGYGVNYNLTTADLDMVVNLFNDDCLWGDANHDNKVDSKDAAKILAYYVGDITGTYDVDEVDETTMCLKKTDVNGDTEYNGKDASLVLKHYVGDITKFPVEE